MTAMTPNALLAIKAQVRAAEARRCAALAADDIDALADLMADDLVHVHTTGSVHTKAQLLDHAGRILRFFEVRRGELNVRVLADDVVVVTGPMTNVVGRRDVDETIEVQAFVTQVWALRDGAWRTVSFHAVRQGD
ncbi:MULTISPECIES: nuclear transport factor 2 family protein [unclassified Novosphingobium]|uniref:nuclear transport factor 2 family protein n=1 Tax=Novosphingobium TaxID=165696 RepID=UPI0014470593|nr:MULTISPECIES: nuclear transport factor 2 family protein [unclassified Novosphingobium]NKJ44822.1 ketosteroid isomerase-like protein [Novosphingobium sp. SG720]NMN05968.1 ketosteroid isomerase-like protein [Novosphingobium sp. SG919]NMN88264.1 ketosteroid isomerase-like protein [Novosphingobium sp. SG916]